MAIIKYLCLTAVPAAAIASLAVHLLIEFKEIDVIDDDINAAIKANPTFVIVNTTNHLNDKKNAGISNRIH